jgi:hypothetical protein
VHIKSSGPTPAPSPSPSPTPVPCADKDHACPTAACGFCGQDKFGCLSAGCPEDIYDHESTGCDGSQCTYHCTCKTSVVV